MRILGFDVTPSLAALVGAAFLLGYSLGPASQVACIQHDGVPPSTPSPLPSPSPFPSSSLPPSPSLLPSPSPPSSPLPSSVVRSRVNRSTARNVVLTMAGGPNYDGEDGRKWAARFGGSFRRVNEDADVVFFTPGVAEAVAPLAHALRLTPHIFSADPASDEPWSRMEVAARRWHLFRVFLEAHEAEYGGGAVLTIDARDAFFQRDPFRLTVAERAASDGRGADVLAFLEHGVTIGSSQWNTDVIAACYPPATLASDGPVYRGVVSCSGTLMASYEGMLVYLRAMEEEMGARRAASAKCQAAGGRDQGFHNVLLHSGRLAARLADAGLGGVRMFWNADGPVQTLQFGDLDMDALGRVLNALGEVAHIVHQFDRKREVAAFVDAAFPLIEPVHKAAWETTLAQWQEAAARRSPPSRYAGGPASTKAGGQPTPSSPPRPTPEQAQRVSAVVGSGTISRTASATGSASVPVPLSVAPQPEPEAPARSQPGASLSEPEVVVTPSRSPSPLVRPSDPVADSDKRPGGPGMPVPVPVSSSRAKLRTRRVRPAETTGTGRASPSHGAA